MSKPLVQVSDLPERPIRVMVVDDAVVFRGFVSRWLAEEPDMQVVGSHRNGHEAVSNLLRADPDVVVLDIEMPELDGLTALPLLLAKKPSLTVIISSTVTRRNAEIGIRALSLGAADYVSKPETNREVASSNEFRRQLVERIRGLGRRRGAVARTRRGARPVAPSGRHQAKFSLRPWSRFPPRIVLVGSSTGGPQALQGLLHGLAPVMARLPVLIAQHMPATFTTILAEHLGRVSGQPAQEGRHGERVVPGRLYVAPGNRHMRVEGRSDAARIVLDDGPPEHFCKPAIDPLFESAATVFGASALAVVLTGMGIDGMRGATRVAAAGGSVIAQDEMSSVIWGMPGAAAHAGVCAGVLPLDRIGSQIVKLAGGAGR